MVNGIIGKKLGMTQLFDPDGTMTPVTVIKAGPCIVVQKKTVNTDGYNAVQLGFVEDKPPKRINKPTEGHFKRAGVPPTRVLREVRVTESEDATNVGDKVLVDIFTEDDLVGIIGKSKGRGLRDS
jgi:large subunit ribosomal protein L3